MKTSIIIGLGFGDEGKGLMTDYLCRQEPQPWVVRFNGGHQAGHTVVTEGEQRHVFSSIGSGTLRGAPTYWSSYCTFYPPGFLTEYRTLMDKGVQPRFYIDARSPVTTFYDVIYNRSLEQSRHPHGSCGLGFGATIERHERGCHLYAADLFQAAVTKTKLNEIAGYYNKKLADSRNPALPKIYASYNIEAIACNYLQAVQACTNWINLVEESPFFSDLKRKEAALIFEGAQGILLDMDSKFFPHVTRSHTTSKNAFGLIRRNSLPAPAIYYVTRSYQTRHGAGPLTNESLPISLQQTDRETNVHNPWQGHFRKAVLDLDLLKYALRCDRRFSSYTEKHLAITCLDQTGFPFPATLRGRLLQLTPEEMRDIILPEAESLLTSHSACSENIVKTVYKKELFPTRSAGIV
ncbi:MAG: adenylosuccinate synthetase [Williamsia sp.]|nr:adenylosuccinate synthetase [Williamsia sp.]